MEDEDEDSLHHHHHHHPPPAPRDRRPDALGDLQVLPDELLCAILYRLDARDVACLACVSSVMYILCNEEPLWMTLCLKDGGEVVYRGSWKKSFLCRKNLITGVPDTCKSLLQFDGFSSLFLYRRWYRCFTTLDAFSTDTVELERKKNLSLDEFSTEFDGQKPVLFTELASTWAARNTWTTDQLMMNYGDIAFRISQRSSKKLTMKFKDYVSYMELQHDEDPLYIFDDEFGEAAPALLKDYDVPHLFQEDLFDVLAQDQRPPFRWLIIGPERSGASWHVDPALTSAWNTLLSGRKRWALYPPGKVPAGVTVHVNEENGDVDIETPSSLQWWLDIYPLLADEDKPLECTQLPGETIFVPSGWWHCVLNLEITIAVTQNFVNASNFELVCLDLAPGHVHKGVCRAGLLAVKDFQEHDYQIDHLNYTDLTRKEKRLRTKPGKEVCRYTNIKDDVAKLVNNSLLVEDFSYNIKFLSKFLDEERDHYNSKWSPSNCIGQRETRAWLHKLWVMKPGLRDLVWKGASLALNVEKWATCLMEICAHHNLPSPSEDEKFPVGTGSNPVYLVSDYVIKIFVEGGPEFSMQCLGAEVEFYSMLQKAKSSLLDHVPNILACGILAYENGIYKAKPYGENSVSDATEYLNLGHLDKQENSFSLGQSNNHGDLFHFGVWRKMQFECRTSKTVTSTRTWAYLVTKRCKGDILANLRDVLSEDDGLNLATFLGCQLRSLHLLPVPSLQNRRLKEIDRLALRVRIQNSLGEDSNWPKLHNPIAISQSIDIFPECELSTSSIDRRRKDVNDRLVQWGDTIPKYLIEKVQEYVPSDVAFLLNYFKDSKDYYKFYGSLTWLHSDVMDDNIHMVSCLVDNYSSSSIFTADNVVNASITEGSHNWHATHILDFSNVCIGDPLNDLIPIHLDVFRGDSRLLKQLLASYGLPLTRKLSVGVDESWKKFQRISYRAMCYCILHEDNVLGAIFSLWKDLRSAKSWEEVELAVWGDLNHYVPEEDY